MRPSCQTAVDGERITKNGTIRLWDMNKDLAVAAAIKVMALASSIVMIGMNTGLERVHGARVGPELM